MTTYQEDLIIVGGSLAGLTVALACAARNLPVCVLERLGGHRVGGDSLTVDLSLLAKVVGHDPRQDPSLPVVPAYRDLTTWPALYGWLRDRVLASPSITLEEGVSVAGVHTDGEMAVITLADGIERRASAVIGADGYRSVVRQRIAPQAPLARYAGYLVWRGLVDENRLKQPVAWPSNGGLWIDFVGGYRLVAATLPGRDGSIEPGHRQITFAWFDAHQQTLLQETGCLTVDGFIEGTLGRGTISQALKNNLLDRVPRVWPELWQEAVMLGIASADSLSGAPIAEYLPHRLANGPLAIVGDAAHVLSPMTGRGFLTAVEDAELLAQLLADKAPDESISAVFARYEVTRMPFIRGLVTHSMRLSAEYRHIASRA
ncbi:MULTISPECIES: FAD-dependent monooxygenase [Pseudomonas]|uniref:Salicylate hydroxylase n=1 Tax=Pseudomonas putida S13.1.2 TaxID=1384061 RepID=A0AAU8S281_PSEPU|nr:MULTISPECIES: FAD-dependent monooxygenase [Pseudomonas]AJQ47117.1 salicylate hydroxylase [Pseudomonas putida S13.1.2]